MPVLDQRKNLGRYELLFVLGQGGMGEVHLARLSGAGGFEKLCIVKTILPAMKAEVQFVERFHHEARVLTHLTHSNIAQVFDMGEVDHTLYMAIEYVAGVDLARVETRCATVGNYLPVPIALHIGRLMCEALGYAHRKTNPEGAPLGIVHRDVSPQNVMVSYEGEVKVIDFGLAKSAARSKHTLPATVMGKLGYMSPEQALAKTVDSRSDIYSAGIVIWEMLAGRPAFQGGTMAEMVAMMANPTFPSIRQFRGNDVSPTLEATVLRALEKDPLGRYARAEDFAKALNEISVREGLSISAEEVGNFVRAMCPEEFAAERNLQSQLSLLRKGPRPPSNPGHHLQPKSGTISAAEAGLGGTFVRDSGSQLPQVADTGPSGLTPAQRALSLQPRSSTSNQTPLPLAVRAPEPAPGHLSMSGDLPFETPKRSKGPIVAVAVVGCALLGVGGFFLFDTSTSGSGERLGDLRPSPSEVSTTAAGASLEPVGSPDLDAVADAQVPRALVVPKGPVFKIIRRSDGAFIDLEKGQRLREGDRLRLIGAPVDGKRRQVFGQARVLELKARNTVAELLMEEDETHPDELFGFVDESVPDQPARVAVKTERPPPKGAEGPIEKAPLQGMKPEELNTFDGKGVEPAKPTSTSLANEPVEPVRAVEPTLSVAPKKEPATKPTLPTMKGTVVMLTEKRGLLRNINTNVRVMVNIDSPPGTQCDVHLPNGRHRVFPVLRPGSNQVEDLEEWPRDPRPDPNKAQRWSLVECRDAAGYFDFRDIVRR